LYSVYGKNFIAQTEDVNNKLNAFGFSYKLKARKYNGNDLFYKKQSYFFVINIIL